MYTRNTLLRITNLFIAALKHTLINQHFFFFFLRELINQHLIIHIHDYALEVKLKLAQVVWLNSNDELNPSLDLAKSNCNKLSSI